MDEIAKANNKALNPTAWVDQYGDYLFRYALSRLRDGDAAEEAVQETFVAALRHVDQLKPRDRSELGCWVFSSVRSST